jgi:uncharacterized protein (DUF488 family)
MIVYTVGHSTRSSEDFLSLLQAFQIERLCDIRTVPKSRKNPQFAAAVLAQSLPLHGIEYIHLPALGGLRHARKDSTNMGWRNESFRGYADYMQTEVFAAAIEHLISLAAAGRVAIMCAEAVPWRCHRSLVGDALLVRGVEVCDIMSPGRATPHQLTPWARVSGTKISYPRESD